MEPHTNGSSNGSDSSSLLPRILEALQIVHAPNSSNAQRQAASSFLEESKKEAPQNGFSLASDDSQSPVVRHYGLSLLEYALKYRWHEYNEDQTSMLRVWIVELGKHISQADPSFLRNKVAQLWADVAKRCWGAEWVDMDSMLNELWLASMVHKEFVLTVLESLSEDVFNSEEVIAALRGSILSKACVEIFTAESVLKEYFPARDIDMGVRCGGEGWLRRIGELITDCLNHDVQQNQQIILKALSTLKTTTNWAILPGLSASEIVERCCSCMGASSPPIQLAAVEVLYNLFLRNQITDEDFQRLVLPMFRPEIVLLMRKLYEWTIVDVQDIDDEKYLLSKRFSEMLSNLAGFLEERPEEIPEASDVPGFLELLLAVTRNQSLAVSIPILSMWVKLLKSEGVVESDAAGQMIGPLLELCSHRLMRYEQLPDDSEEVSYQFLSEDFDTIPEKHAFVGNYRRYCTSIVEIVVRQKPFEALYHILGQADHYFKSIDQQPLDIQRYRKVNPVLLTADAKFSFVEAGLRGYMKWKNSSGTNPEKHEHERTLLEQNLETWCVSLLGMTFSDPLVRKRALQVTVAFSTTALNTKTSLMLKVLEHLLGTLPPTSDDTNQEFAEAMKELQSDCTHELQRLAVKMPDYLNTVYDELEAKVNEIIATSSLDKRQQIAYQSFLFTISFRATTIESDVRARRLEGFLHPLTLTWQSDDLKNATSSLESFRQTMAFDKVQSYLVRQKVHEIKDWSQCALDEEGRQLQEEMSERLSMLPLRATKSLLGVSTEKVKPNSTLHKTACDIWQNLITILLPRILEMIRFSQSFHNPETWTELPPTTVRNILADRFWQACISTGTRDDFYARVSGTKATMEGFASSIRGTLRTIRESCYSIIYCMSRLREHFYGLEGLPGPLANAVLADAHHLSSHQFSILLTMARHVIDDCPPVLREHFLPPLVASLMTQMDVKIMGEWDAIAERTHVPSAASDDLTAEMKEESILRHLTWPAVMIVASLCDPDRDDDGQPPTYTQKPPASTTTLPPSSKPPRPALMRTFVLSNLAITGPLISFACNALRIRDTRASGVIIRVLSSIVPAFTSLEPSTNAEIREFLSTDVLKAAITALHDAYFVDVQRDLAGLIAGILMGYREVSGTGVGVLCSLPGIGEERVKEAMEQMGKAASPKAQRAVLLQLLAGLRAVSVAEQGSLKKGVGKRRARRSAMMEGFVEERGGIEEVEGVQRLFDG